MIGNLVKDPEIKNTANSATGTPLKIASFAIAVNERKNKDGTQKVQYFNMTAFDKVAEIMERYVKKGHKVCITGSLNNRSWDKPDGTKGYATDVVITELELLTSKMDAEKMGGEEESSQPKASYTAPAKSYNKKSSAEPVLEAKLPVINIDDLNVQMPF